MTHLACEGFTDPEEPTNNLRPEKVISETGLLLFAASSVRGDPEIRSKIKNVAKRLVPHARSERMRLGICMEPALAWDYAFAHVCLSRIGYPDPSFDSVLTLVRESQAQWGRERPPHRALEQAWAQKGLERGFTGGETQGDAAPAAAQASLLVHPMDLLNGSREDVYAFTHSLMYVTDFNVKPWTLPRDRDLILAEAEALLARAIDDQDYDLAGEVLLAWPLTGTSWSPTAAFGFRVLATVEDQAGFLPSTATRLERLTTLQGEDRKKYLLATAYHTAYVMGLLCATSLQPERAPPLAIGESPATPEVSAKFLRTLDDDERRPHWRAIFQELPPRGQNALADMLFAIALRRSTVNRDFSAVHDLLQKGGKDGLTNTPIASQAAELMSRLAAIS